jgi:hypothetical protein
MSVLRLDVPQAERKHFRRALRDVECCAVGQRKISAHGKFGNSMHKGPGGPCHWKWITRREIARLLRSRDAAHEHIEGIPSDWVILA